MDEPPELQGRVTSLRMAGLDRVPANGGHGWVQPLIERAVRGDVAAFTITGASDWTGTCDLEDPFVAVPVFYRVGSYHWALSPDQGYGVTLIDIGDGHTVAVMLDAADDADLADFMAEAAPIVATFDFPPR